MVNERQRAIGSLDWGRQQHPHLSWRRGVCKQAVVSSSSSEVVKVRRGQVNGRVIIV